MPDTALDLSLSKLEASLGLLGSLNQGFLQEAWEAGSLLALSEDQRQLLYRGESVLDNVDDLWTCIDQALTVGPRLLLPRLSNKTNAVHPNPERCLAESFDSSESIVISGLRTPSKTVAQRERAPAHWARTLLLIGAPSLAALDISSLPTYIDRIIVIETKPRDLAISLALIDLDQLINTAKSFSVGLQIIFDYNIDILKAQIRDQIVGLQPMILNGMCICRSPIENPQLSVIDSWLHSPEGITQSVAGSFGGEVDELNQLLQALFTASQTNSRSLLAPQPERENQPVVLIASGPSLDEALPWLKMHKDQLQIVSAGSSLGALVRNDIIPNAAVFLERSSIVYDNDIHELINEGYDLSSVSLITSMTVDPRIHSCFGSVAWFHRPLSTTLAFFYDEAIGKLVQSGPQSANAALEALLHLGHKKILAIGCDFGAERRSHPRASQALGSSNRNLDLPVKGRSGKTVYSSPTLYDSAQYFANAIRIYGADLYSVPFGVELASANISLCRLNQNLADEFANKVSLSEKWNILPKSSLNSIEMLRRLDDISKAFDAWIVKISKLINDADKWSLELSRQLDQIFKLDETGLSPAEVLVKRLIHYPMFLSVQPLNDASLGEWYEYKKIVLSNLQWLRSIYETYLEFLPKIISAAPNMQFDWDLLKMHVLLKSSNKTLPV